MLYYNIAHLSWVLPLGGLGDMVHEVDLTVGRLRHLPPGGQVVCDVIALLPQVLQLLVALKQKITLNNCDFIFGGTETLYFFCNCTLKL